MPRTIPSSVAAAIQSDAFELPALVLVELSNGSVMAFTNWDQSLDVDLNGDGSETYLPNKFEGLSAFSAQINGPIDDSDLILIIDGSGITADKVRRGVFDNSVVTIGYVLPDDLANPWLHRKYDVGQSSIEGLKIRLELMGPEKRLEQPVGFQLTANCSASFGDNDCGIQSRANAWAASTAYAQHSIVKRLTGTGIYWFKATTGGTSGGSEPAWPATISGTVSDGTVTWTAFRARRLIGTVTSSANRTTIVATGITVANDWFGEGFLTFLTGDNAGDVRRVKSDNGTGTLTLHQSAFDDIAIGDTFEVVAGCRKRFTEDCIGKHDNANNSSTRTLRYVGDPYLAEENVTVTAPKG